jgi:hypothetical protein
MHEVVNAWPTMTRPDYYAFPTHERSFNSNPGWRFTLQIRTGIIAQFTIRLDPGLDFSLLWIAKAECFTSVEHLYRIYSLFPCILNDA